MSSVAPTFELDAAAPGTLGVRGVLNFETAAAAWPALKAKLTEAAPTRLDLSGVQRSDSVGLACVLAAAAESGRQGRKLQVLNMPAGMQALAQMCEVNRLLD